MDWMSVRPQIDDEMVSVSQGFVFDCVESEIVDLVSMVQLEVELFTVVEAVIENKLFTIDMGFSRHKESDAGCSFQRNVDALDALPKLVLKGEEK